MSWKADAPSNIALIKYMGKTDSLANIPCNTSLSYTLDHLTSTVELTLVDATEDRWEPLSLAHRPANALQLNEAAQVKFLEHLKRIKTYFSAEDLKFVVRSNNDFPADCGLASSASSFAALTKAACQALAEITAVNPFSTIAQAHLSQLGSGSSCRSFFAPWAIWEEDSVKPLKVSTFPTLLHQVIVVSRSKKAISSSLAHKKIATSLLFADRPERANVRCSQLIDALMKQDWYKAYEISWQEFWDMHSLFETSSPSFGYMTHDSIEVLNQLRTHWKDQSDGPIITMDAGPNVHLLYRNDQIKLAKYLNTKFSENHLVISNYD